MLFPRYPLNYSRGLSSSRLHNPSEMGVLAGEVAESTIDAFTPTSKARVDSYGKSLRNTICTNAYNPRSS
jgi:hypothetical protein